MDALLQIQKHWQKISHHIRRQEAKNGLLTDIAFGTDIEELGLSYTNVNIVMNELINGSGYSYTYNGKTYQYSSIVLPS